MVFNTLELLKTAVAIEPSSIRELCWLPDYVVSEILLVVSQSVTDCVAEGA